MLLHVVVVGQDLFRIVEEKFQLVGINKVNRVNGGMLGNLKLLTLECELEDVDALDYRKKLLREIAADDKRLMPMIVSGDWMRIFVTKPIPDCCSQLKQAP